MISLTNLKKSVPSPVKGQSSHVKGSSGFTLLELLIVIAIIAILSIALVFMLNPAETLKKARDAQRISDLKTVKTALGIMLTASSTPNLDNFGSVCTTNSAGTPQTPKIAYSVTVAPTGIIGAPTATGDAVAVTAFAGTGYVATGVAGSVNGDGWIPVKLRALTGGTPISSFPVDPTNTVTTAGPVTADLVYRYACQNGSNVAGKPPFIFEIDAQLESNAYTVDDDKRLKDGGDLAGLYESGNSLNLLPITATF